MPGGKDHCCVPLCTNDKRYHPELSFHKFPEDPERRKIWIVRIRRDEGTLFQITPSTKVCSSHFLPEDFKWSPVRKVLNSTAIPSIFAWSKQAGRAPPKERPPVASLPSKRRKQDGDTEGIEYDAPVEDHSADDDTTPSEEQDDELVKRIRELEEKISEQNQEKASLKEENNKLKQQLSLETFGVERFGSDDTIMLFYTGFICSTFRLLFEFVKPAADNMQSAYYAASERTSLRGRPRNMLLIDELFMFLCRLKAGLYEQDLAIRFKCHISTVSRKIITWANLLYFVLGSIPIWPSRGQVDNSMPQVFKDKYPKTRVILDCTEIKIQTPSSLVLSSKTYSSYKSHSTFKGLIGIAPNGAITFISSLFTGCTSDTEITRLSGIIDLLEEGDSVMADKGFTIGSQLKEKKVSLNIPPFRFNSQFTLDQIAHTQEIASLRIHVERAIRRTKEHHLFDSVIPISTAGSINQLWTVACLLTLWRGPLIKVNEM
ncbi:uncharacterized protein LOC106156822 [Lingula anatina]|uniref:Uncharacterized protein LOC106156822 n=1 Tax=Lingula anatina TaxID=7574 RepID=A0A1S3HQ90_LINAN|nr:uncharacterized protein LOC106156822 [Lingula anatina]|eukprot:XP_013387706.1 uncharacterized protein LOC106156822 [Lingula anatina]